MESAASAGGYGKPMENAPKAAAFPTAFPQPPWKSLRKASEISTAAWKNPPQTLGFPQLPQALRRLSGHPADKIMKRLI